jgi:hypothetical protein
MVPDVGLEQWAMEFLGVKTSAMKKDDGQAVRCCAWRDDNWWREFADW